MKFFVNFKVTKRSSISKK